MRVGFLPGDLNIELNESRCVSTTAIPATAYNLLSIWLRLARDQLRQAKSASDAFKDGWGKSDEENRELLLSELGPSLQVFVACGIALDCLYDQLRPYAKLADEDIQKWKDKKTGRGAQITEVIRRVYKVGDDDFAQLKQNISEIIKYRDKAVHPSLELQPACTRPDVPVLVDWKFAVYRYTNAEMCLRATVQIVVFLYKRQNKITKTPTRKLLIRSSWTSLGMDPVCF